MTSNAQLRDVQRSMTKHNDERQKKNNTARQFTAELVDKLNMNMS